MNNLEASLQNEKLMKDNLKVELTLERARKEQEMERVKEFEVELRGMQDELKLLKNIQQSGQIDGVEGAQQSTYRKDTVSF